MSLLGYLRPKQVLLHIPKTGGTWLGDVVAANRRWYEAPLIRQLSHGNNVARVDQRFGVHVRLGFVFRDPLARLHSAFDSRRNYSQPTRHTPWTPAEVECFNTFPGFDDFARAFALPAADPLRQKAETALAQVGHFKRGLVFFFQDVARLEALRPRILFCADTPNLRHLLPALSRSYGIRPLIEPTSARSHSSRNFRTPVTDEGRAALGGVLAPEYAIFVALKQIEAQLHGNDLP